MEEYKENATLEREKRSKLLIRLITSATGIAGFEGETADEVFDVKNEQGRRELIERLSGEQYCELITGVNGILREINKEEWEMDGAGVTVAGEEVIAKHIFPNQEHKKGIILKSWKFAQVMNTQKRDLDDIGMLLGSLLVETHPYKDGNGRTSRLVYSLIKNGYNKEETEEILGEEGREKFDMALSKTYINKLFRVKYGIEDGRVNKHRINGIQANEQGGAFGQLQFPEGVEKDVAKTIIEGGRNDSLIFATALVRFLNSHPEIAVEDCLRVRGERRILLLQNLLSILSAERISEFANVYWEIKKQYTEDMIDIFVHPDNEEYQIERDGKRMSMLEYFKQRVANSVMLL